MSVRIPTEILELVISATIHLKAITGNPEFSITSILCTCRRWYDVGVKTLWADISLRSHAKLTKLADPKNGDLYHQVRSLTIHIDIVEPQKYNGPNFNVVYLEGYEYIIKNGSSETQGWWKALWDLTSAIKQMVSLRSFSLFVHGSNMTAGSEGFFFQATDIKNLIANLPQNVSHLEIDTHGYERHEWQGSSHHICAALAQNLHSLEHLRLRLARLCPALIPFIASNPQMKTVDINLVAPTYLSTIKPCLAEPDELVERTSLEVQYERSASVRREMVTALDTIRASAPTLQRLDIIDAKPSLGGDDCFAIVKRDLLANKTTTCPHDYIRLPNNKDGMLVELRVPGGLLDPTKAHDPTSEPTSEAIFVPPGLVGDAVEGRSWVQTVEGYRFPAEYANSQPGKRYRYLRMYDTKEEILEKYRPRQGPAFTDLWRKETEAGRPLLKARVTDGVGEVEPLYREHLQTQQSS